MTVVKQIKARETQDIVKKSSESIKTVVVLCLPRSGSSLLAGILYRLGVWMGELKDMRLGRHTNIYGNYENQDFYRANLKILARAKSTTLSWADIPDDAKVKDAVTYFRPLLKGLIEKNSKKLWGWKDPVCVFALPYYEDLLPNPCYIALKRNVDSVVKSHMESGRFLEWHNTMRYMVRYMNIVTLFRIFIRILKYYITKGMLFNNFDAIKKIKNEGYKRIDEFIRTRKHITIIFEEMVKNPRQTIEQIIKFLEINPTQKQINKAIGFIDPNEIHH
ncbi:MAG: hypothetical protein BAJALOKI1v1_2250002 [Promethearchaeota archaeon]|nr:MAG: hypothetical protein BAJALOKI1v1_2250002 [Candidatus Lokiarchaeota archaeon]